MHNSRTDLPLCIPRQARETPERVSASHPGSHHPGGLALWLKVTRLKKARVRSYWVNASARMQVRPYAIFWQGYVCEKLHANGGKGAKRDRDAFEEDFGVLSQ